MSSTGERDQFHFFSLFPRDIDIRRASRGQHLATRGVSRVIFSHIKHKSQAGKTYQHGVSRLGKANQQRGVGSDPLELG